MQSWECTPRRVPENYVCTDHDSFWAFLYVQNRHDIRTKPAPFYVGS